MTNTLQYRIFSDGGSRGNPGPAAYGFVIYNKEGTIVAEHGKYIGTTTNNQAEYQGIVAALEAVLALPHHEGAIVCNLDSQLVVRQIEGIYKMKHPDLKPWLVKVHALVAELGNSVSFTHIPRADNAYADRLVNTALDAVLGANSDGAST